MAYVRPMCPGYPLFFRTVVGIGVFATVLSSCVDRPTTDAAARATPTDTTWTGEMRMTAGDTSIRICGTGHVYHLTGPAMDTIVQRYTGARMRTGQRMKLWVSGHFGTVERNGLVDSVLHATKFQHLDASLRCDPVPEARVSGDWKLDDVDPHRPRDIHVHLYTNGTARMITDLRNGQSPFEEDGSWGVDGEGAVQVNWPLRAQTMSLQWEPGILIGTDRRPGMRVTLHRVGPADPMAGVFGRTARWLAASATALGKPTSPESIVAATRLDTLFATPEAQHILRAQALDTLQPGVQEAAVRLDAVRTAHDLLLLMRIASRH